MVTRLFFTRHEIPLAPLEARMLDICIPSRNLLSVFLSINQVRFKQLIKIRNIKPEDKYTGYNVGTQNLE